VGLKYFVKCACVRLVGVSVSEALQEDVEATAEIVAHPRSVGLTSAALGLNVSPSALGQPLAIRHESASGSLGGHLPSVPVSDLAALLPLTDRLTRGHVCTESDRSLA
jgi:hypothetical protein